MKDAPDPQPPPNYEAAARAQGAANVETARAQGRINNPNVNTPYGTQTVTFAEPPSWESFIRSRGQDPAVITRGAGTAYDREYESLGGQPTVTQTLAPAQQALLDSQNRISQNLAGVAESGLNRVSQGMQTPFDTSALLSQRTSVPGGNYTSNVGFTPAQSSYGSGGSIQYGTNYNQPITQGFDVGPGARTSTGYNQPIQGQIADAGRQQTSFGDAGRQQTAFANVGGPQRSVDFSGVTRIPGVNDFSADRQRVEQALYSRLEPQFQRDEDALRTRLANQGLASGSEAWNRELDTLNRGRNDARMQAILAGGGEQSRLFGLGMSARQQGVGEQLSQGNFANTAQAQAYGQELGRGQFANQAQQNQFGQNQAVGQFANQAQLAQFGQNQAAGQFANQAQAQGFNQSQADLAAYNAALAQNYAQNQGAAQFQNQAQAQGYTQAQGNAALQNQAQAQANAQNQAAAQFANQAAQQTFGMGQQNAALNNTVQQQQFQQGLTNANLANQSRQRGIEEQAYLRQLPLNELSALRTGAQVQTPQFQPFQGATVGQTPVFNAAQQAAQYQQGLYNSQVGQANSANQGLYGLGASALSLLPMFFSDRRLKSNIHRIATLENGIPIYGYEIFGHHEIGVMADEVEQVMPWAVVTHPSGFKMVNYGVL